MVFNSPQIETVFRDTALICKELDGERVAFLQVFDSPEIKTVFRYKEFKNKLSEAEKAVWVTFKSV